MGALRTKMVEEMRLRNFSPRTHESYLRAMVGLVKYYRRSPDQLTQEEIRAYLLHLEERGLSASSRNIAISGLKFFYHQILGWNEQKLFIPPRKRTGALPEVLSQQEVEQLLLASAKLRDRCLLMTAYGTGLRVSELVSLKLSDIDPQRMMIRVEQGKGRKDRYTILSERLFSLLQRYRTAYQPAVWIFSVKTEHDLWTSVLPRRSTIWPNRELGFTKAKGSTPFVTALPPIFWKRGWIL